MKKLKTNEELLLAFTKANRTRKQVLALREGFNDVKKFKEYLEMKVQLGSNKGIDELSGEDELVKETITHITVLDRSGSMSYGGSGLSPMEVAKRGVAEDLLDADKNNEDYYVIGFGSSVTAPQLIKSAAEIRKFSANMGMTALHDAVLMSIRLAQTKVGKVLIKVFTDGGENSSRAGATEVKNAIELAQKANITVTFIGQDATINRLVDNLKVDRSNTLTYDGSTEDMHKSFNKMSASTVSYRGKVASGQNVSTGFYKDLN